MESSLVGCGGKRRTMRGSWMVRSLTFMGSLWARAYTRGCGWMGLLRQALCGGWCSPGETSIKEPGLKENLMASVSCFIPQNRSSYQLTTLGVKKECTMSDYLNTENLRARAQCTGGMV